MARSLRWTPPAELLAELREIAAAFLAELPVPEDREPGKVCPASLLTEVADVARPDDVDEPASLHTFHHLVCRTVQSRMLLRPGHINDLLVGCLARAQEAAPAVGICGFDFQSNHYHIAATTPDAPTLSHFMNIFQSTAAVEVNHTHDWSNHVWARRFRSILTSSEALVQLERLLYIFGQGCESNLVASPLEWPGACTHQALVDGKWTIEGTWIDRTELYERGRRSKDASDADVAEVSSRNVLHLTKLPAFSHLSDDVYRGLMQRCVEAIERATAERHAAENTRPLGVAKVLAVHPHQRPKKTKRSPAPPFHATREIFKRLQAAYRAFVDDYYAAAERLAAGDVDVTFPVGCFPPRLPVRSAEGMPGRPRAPG